MIKVPSDDKRAEIAEIKNAIQNGKLIAVLGTGVSIALTGNSRLSWKSLIQHGFKYAVKMGTISPSRSKAWKTQLESDDLDERLSAAEFMSRKLNAPTGDLYARWLKTTFSGVSPENHEMASALRALHGSDVPLCTTNFDQLLERITELPTINMEDTGRVAAWIQREDYGRGILHLHGTWDVPATCLLGIRDYESTIGNELRDLFQRSITSFHKLLFIGCGDTFGDPNFLALISWLRDNMKAATPQHYSLVRASDLAKRATDPTWHGFVDPISYGMHHNDLPSFLLKLARPDKVASFTVRNRSARLKRATTSAKHTKALHNYRMFLLNDCGTLTIDGLRADMETAQKRFDIERLFVPLNLLPVPPDIPMEDQFRGDLLAEWAQEHSDPIPFNKVFLDHRSLALLAMPGGGKTVLLKRLAVAYADPARRKQGDDDFPDLGLMPILIRCRECKEHIRRPIAAILKLIPIITGHDDLESLSDALKPLLKNGRVLLLIDGLDEIHDDSDRRIFAEHLETFVNQYKLIRLVVTSREAGFNLVAPSLARCCERWSLAPLDEPAISLLCSHWHVLMKGSRPEASRDARQIATSILQNNSLRRLAESPLLLTMLLVVRYGSGRLPPDRVGLYDRAVEVLLDTWNIQGHEPLNVKEALPQLAFIAFEMLRKGQQTATESELLALLEGAREKIPHIRRYAKGTPHEFLKRVELRSSLLVEAGHQLVGRRLTPFYQFRHLTFQEFLSAYAVVNGYYSGHRKADTLLTPLKRYLTEDRWREVIPMAAAMAGKQGEPLIVALIADARVSRKHTEDKDGESLRYVHDIPSVSRLIHCLLDEAEVSSEFLPEVLQIIVFHNGIFSVSDSDWATLTRGIYGDEFLHQSWLLYRSMRWPKPCRVMETLSMFLTYRDEQSGNDRSEQQKLLERRLESGDPEDVGRALLTLAGGNMVLARTLRDQDGCEWLVRASLSLSSPFPWAAVEELVFDDDQALWTAAVWAWATRRRIDRDHSRASLLDRLLSLWLMPEAKTDAVASALLTIAGMARECWHPILTEAQKDLIRRRVDFEALRPRPDGIRKGFRDIYDKAAGIIVAFYARDVYTDLIVAEGLLLMYSEYRHLSMEECGSMLKQLDVVDLRSTERSLGSHG
jgi:hypothetical protein